jgi:signal transduction histidine kinase
VLGFEFSEEETTQIQELTGLPLEYYSVDSPSLPQGLVSELAVDSPFTYRIKQDQITGYYMLEDIFGEPAVIVALVQPREVYQAGQEIRNNFLTIILGIGFFLGTVAIIYADRTILKRVTYLSDEISEIAEIDDLSARVKGSEESDEIGVLSKRINEMLTRLDESRKAQQSQREKGIREIFAAAKKISFLVNTEMERPLHSMKQVAYDLRDENNRELADILENSIKYTESTLIELASLSNLGEPKRTVSDLNEVMEAAIANVEPKVRVSIESVTDEAFLAINIDAVKVARAFENIIRNAVEAIEVSGFVKVSVSVDKENAIVTVTDNGVGIPKNQIDFIFEPFYSTKKDTMGLGLVYAKQVIEAHGGSITVESTEGVGTKVTVRIPLIQPNE